MATDLLGPPSAAAKIRDKSLDGLRGLLIVLVVFGHFPFRVLAPSDFSSALSGVAGYIYLFHIPAFFVMSGILSRRPRSLASVLWAQVPLYTAFAFWSLLSRWELLASGDVAGVARLLLLGNWPSVQGVTWFLPTLISVRLLAAGWLAGGPTTRSGLIIASVGAVLGHETVALYNAYIPFGLGLALFMLPMILGCRWVYEQRSRLTSLKWSLGFLGLFLATTTVLFFLEPLEAYNGFTLRIDLAQANVTETLLNYGLLLVAVCALVAAFAAGIRLRLFEMLGIFSMTIFLIHPKLMSLLTSRLPVGESGSPSLVYVGAIIVICCGAGVLISLAVTMVSPIAAKYLGLSPQEEVAVVGRMRDRMFKPRIRRG